MTESTFDDSEDQKGAKGQTPISKIKRNNRACTNKAEIADQFNKHFVNVGQNLAKKIDNCDGSPTQFIRSTPVASFVMSCVTETQVCSLFKGLNDHKSSLDIPNKLIKIDAHQPWSIPLTYIYNQSIETGIVPDILKVKIAPVYKGGDATDPSNYRPIATPSPFNKVLERLAYNQFYYMAESVFAMRLVNLRSLTCYTDQSF